MWDLINALLYTPSGGRSSITVSTLNPLTSSLLITDSMAKFTDFVALCFDANGQWRPDESSNRTPTYIPKLVKYRNRNQSHSVFFCAQFGGSHHTAINSTQNVNQEFEFQKE